MTSAPTYTAFLDARRVAHGPLAALVAALRAHPSRATDPSFLIFEDHSGRQVELDLDALPAAAPDPEPPAAERGPGRPRLGVVSREVSLLPRHWEWLEAQPSGISAALRRLVDEARRAAPGAERARELRTAASQFMTAIAGDLAGYEEASRALFAKDLPRFEQHVAAWPEDVRDHVVRLAREAVTAEASDRA